MRILYCSATYPPHLNGQSVFTKNLTEGMARFGHEVTALIPAEKGYPARYTSNGIRFIRVPAINLAWLHQDFRLPMALLANLQRIFHEVQPEIVHLQDPSPLSQAVLHEAHRRNIPVLLTHHTGPEINAPYLCFKTPWLKQVTNWMTWQMVINHLNRGDLVTVPSRYSALMLARQGVHSAVKTVPCGVMLDDFYPDETLDRRTVRVQYGLDADKRLFLYVGRVDPEKNIDVLLKAMRLVRRDDVQFAIAGQGTQTASLKEWVAAHGLQERVRFLDRVDHARLPALINCADVFVMPGQSESFSIATVEAMACGKPVLAPGSAALPELVSHDVNGYLYRPGNPEDAAQCIEGLAENPQRWTEMGSISLTRAQRFSLDQVLQAYEQTYRSVCKQGKAIRYRTVGKVTASGAQPFHHQLGLQSSRIVLTALMLIFFLFSSLFFDQAQAYSVFRTPELASLEINKSANVLIIAPHSSDEIAAAGGLIQRVQETGGQVHIVLVTGGNDLIAAAPAAKPKVKAVLTTTTNLVQPSPVEIFRAYKNLGLSADQVISLGYPRRQINNLWNGNWQGVQAPLPTDPEAPAGRPHTLLLGADLFGDLRAVLDEVQPDLILVPHPEDTDSDHSAVSNFAQFAIGDYLASSAQSKPIVLAYLLQYDAYPAQRNNSDGPLLVPPPALSAKSNAWYSFDLNAAERINKRNALLAIESGQGSQSGRLNRFAQPNEIYFQLPVIALPVVGFDHRDVLEEDLSVDAPPAPFSREEIKRLFFAEAEIMSWNVTRLGDLVCFSAETDGKITDDLHYRVLAKLPNGSTMQVSDRDELLTPDEHMFGACFNIDEIGDPDTIGFSAETWTGDQANRTAWHFVYLSKFPWQESTSQ